MSRLIERAKQDAKAREKEKREKAKETREVVPEEIKALVEQNRLRPVYMRGDSQAANMVVDRPRGQYIGIRDLYGGHRDVAVEWDARSGVNVGFVSARRRAPFTRAFTCDLLLIDSPTEGKEG
jgi:hypothetical protein